MRKYLPTLGELIDRLTIVQLKEVKIPQHKEEYQKEIKDIVHDINQILLDEKLGRDIVDGDMIRAIIVLAQMNTHIWVNEDNARNGDERGNKLLLTHGLNGIRNTAKNKIQEKVGGRKDYKIDCIASEFKDWGSIVEVVETKKKFSKVSWRVVAILNSFLVLTFNVTDNNFLNALYMNITGFFIYYIFDRILE